MAESSKFWNGTALGDATEAPYDAFTEFSEVMRDVAGISKPGGGVIKGLLNELEVTDVGAGNVQVNTGCGLVHGTWYKNTAAITIAIPTPVGAARRDNIVLRKDWAAQTVRVVKVAGVEGGAAPVLTKTIGTTYEIKLAEIWITVGGVITVKDARIFVGTPVQFRAGGSATHWNTGGTTKYTAVFPGVQIVVIDCVISAGNVSEGVTFDFPVPFKYNPAMVVTVEDAVHSSTAQTCAFAQIVALGNSGAGVMATRQNYADTAGNETVTLHCVAYGEFDYYDL